MSTITVSTSINMLLNIVDEINFISQYSIGLLLPHIKLRHCHKTCGTVLIFFSAHLVILTAERPVLKRRND